MVFKKSLYIPLSFIFTIALFVSLFVWQGYGVQAGHNKTYAQVDVLRIGLIPDEGENKTYEQAKEILDRFSLQTKIPYKFVPSESYKDVLNKFINKEVDFAFLGAMTYLKAREAAGAIPLVIRDIDMEFTTSYLVPIDSSAKTIVDLKGKIIAFGSKLSTSGHIMPRFFLSEEGIVPEKFFGEVIYSGAHDKTAFLVEKGEADVGAASSDIVDGLLKSGKLDSKKVRILEKTSSYPNNLWVIQPYVSEDIRAVLQQTFTALIPNNEEDRELLDKTGTAFFLPADHQDFIQIEEAVNSLKLDGGKI
ncbi:MAG: phosphate/phosphite/phosphonate ABC transporter substrate-binding protein [Proteobacteria bacterium]|nr:phosphate/phosphite/phosphonate ABC transporter substrate-binding protein [Pseudomonadota bacterium]